MERKSKSEQMIGNTRAKRGKHESMVLRLRVDIVDGLYACLEAEDFPGDPNKRDVLEEAERILIRHIESVTGEQIARAFIHEDEEALRELSPE